MKNLILSFLAIFFIISCSRDNDESTKQTEVSIIGKWKADSSSEDVTNMEFTDSGKYYYKISGSSNTWNGTYEYSNQKLTTKISDNGTTVTDVVSCTIDGNKLTLESSRKYTRQ